MKKISFFLIVITLFIFACGNETNNDEGNNNTNEEIVEDNNIEEDNKAEESKIEILDFDKAILDNLSGIKGDFIYGYKWKDKMGLNELIFTTEDKFIDWKDPDCKGCGEAYIYLKAYHFTGEEDGYSLVRMIQDGAAKGCSNPPFGLENEFYENSISITDLNDNGYAEITFMYFMLCASGLTPVPTKLIMLENNEKYAIRGNSYIMEAKIGGEKNLDLGNADKVLKDYASKTWDKFCKPNPNGQTANNDDFDIFWKKFQKAIASKNKQSLLNICTNNMKEFVNTPSSYKVHINDRMRKEVAKATVKDVDKMTKDAEFEAEKQKIFYYEETGSSFGFWFTKTNGKWLVSGPQIGG